LALSLGIAGATHADLDFVFLQERDVIGGRVLHAAIGMMDQAGWDGARSQGHAQSCEASSVSM